MHNLSMTLAKATSLYILKGREKETNTRSRNRNRNSKPLENERENENDEENLCLTAISKTRKSNSESRCTGRIGVHRA